MDSTTSIASSCNRDNSLVSNGESTSKTQRLLFLINVITLLTMITITGHFIVPRAREQFIQYALVAKADSFEQVVMAMPVESLNLSRVDYRVFQIFFDDVSINKFKRNYHVTCRRMTAAAALTRRPPKLYGAVVDGGNCYGFGSVLNNVLNAYLIARDPAVQRTFQLFELPTPLGFTPISHFIDDFAAGTPCPLLTSLEDPASPDRALLDPENGNFTIQVNEVTGRINVSGNDRVAVRYATGPGWMVHGKAMARLWRRDALSWSKRVFYLKSALARALWSPKPYFRKLLMALWNVLDGSFFALHLRRTDKISVGEMETVPLTRYVDALDAFCLKSIGGACTRRVFVMYDDPVAYRDLKALAGGNFILLELADLLAGENFDGVRELILGGERCGDKGTLQRHTRELVVSLTLMAMAERVVCTFSSNLSRFVALLRGDLTVFHSLDREWSVV